MTAVNTLVIECVNSRTAETLQLYLLSNPQAWGEMFQANIQIVRLKNLLFVAVYVSKRFTGLPDAQTKAMVSDFLVCQAIYPVQVNKSLRKTLGKSYSFLSLNNLMRIGLLRPKQQQQIA